MKDIKGFEGRYAITSCGRVWSYLNNKFLAQRFDKYGYPRVTLRTADGRTVSPLIHRLVAETYIPNPLGLETVNHKDEVKTHNYIDNLEWMSRQDNIRYGTRTERASKKCCKPVICVETGEVYESIKAAAAAKNTNPQNISHCLRGQQKTCGGYHWEYAKS